MKRFLLSVIMGIGLLTATACGQTEELNKPVEVEQVQQVIQIEVTGNDGESYSAEIESGEYTSLMEALKAEFEVQENGGFITSIEDITPDENKKEFLAIYVDGEMAEKGANDLTLEEGQEVSIIVENWE